MIDMKELIEEVENGPYLTRFQQTMVDLGIKVYTGHRIRPGWKASLPFYAWRCPIHGTVENYPQGYEGKLACPHCLEESREEAIKRTEEVKENVQQ